MNAKNGIIEEYLDLLKTIQGIKNGLVYQLSTEQDSQKRQILYAQLQILDLVQDTYKYKRRRRHHSK